MYPLWRGLIWRHQDRLYPPWRDLDVFTRDLCQLIGPKPPRSQFRLIDPNGKYEPGNIQWLDREAAGELLREQMIKYVTLHGSSRFSEIREAFGVTNNVATANLARLVETGELARIKRGTYARP